MPAFTKTQYEHFGNRFRYLINAKVEALGKPEELSNDDKVDMVLSGKAKIKEQLLIPDEEGSCRRGLDNFLTFFEFPGDDVRSAKRAKLMKEQVKLRDKLLSLKTTLIDKYVVGLLSGDELLAEIKKLEATKK